MQNTTENSADIKNSKKIDANKWMIKTDTGDIDLSPATIRKYLVSGKNSDIVTEQELMMFHALCKGQNLNPFLKEAYLIKYSVDAPAQLVTGKDVFTKRAAKSKDCAGWKAGVIIRNKDGQTEYRDGTFYTTGEMLLGGWAEVYRHGWKEAIRSSVPLGDYQKKNRSGDPIGTWKDIPGTMIRKVALVQALREAFPQDLQGLYAEEEFSGRNPQVYEQQAVRPQGQTKTEAILGKIGSKAPMKEEPATTSDLKKEDAPISVTDHLNGDKNDSSSSQEV